MCKKKQAMHINIDSLPTELQEGQKERMLIEDFARAHTFTFIEAFNALLVEGPVDLRKKHVLVELTRRPGETHNGNPATLYEVQNISMQDNPDGPCGDVILEETIKCVLYGYDDMLKSLEGNPAASGLLVILCTWGSFLWSMHRRHGLDADPPTLNRSHTGRPTLV